MLISCRYRVLPNKRQHRAIEAILESQRELYNAALEERISAYRKVGLTRSYMDQAKALTLWRRSDTDARNVPLSIQRGTLKQLDRAYAAFFRRLAAGQKPGFPRFRGAGWFDSFTFNEFDGITLKQNGVRFKGMPGRLRIHFHRQLPEGSIRSCTFRRDARGWTVAFRVAIAEARPRTGDKAVGVDLGLTVFAALSDGGWIPSVRAAQRAQRRLRLAQRALARKKPGSIGHQKARTNLRRCHEAVVRRRDEHLHQASARLVRDYDLIAVERLNVRGLANGMLAKAVRDASWSKFVSMLRYKAEKAGVQLIEVDSINTSQECSGCGAVATKSLSDRHHDCAQCGLSIDRDLNAARNILQRAGVGPSLRNAAAEARVQA